MYDNLADLRLSPKQRLACAVVDSLGKLHTRCLMIRFDGNDNNHEMARQHLNDEIAQVFHRSRQLLTHLTHISSSSSSYPLSTISPAEGRIRQNLQQHYAAQLDVLSRLYRTRQQAFGKHMQRLHTLSSGMEEIWSPRCSAGKPIDPKKVQNRR